MAPSGVGAAWSETNPDLESRDPNNLNDHLTITWEETFGEPDAVHSIDCVWKYSAKCFTMWKTLCYIIMSTCCGIPIASCWGCYFACVACQHIWEITPQLRAMAIDCSVLKRIFTIILGACLEPCCESCGKIFTAFKQ